MKCKFYPTDEELEMYGPFCGACSDISGGPPCTKENEYKCQWAKETKNMSNKYWKYESKGGSILR